MTKPTGRPKGDPKSLTGEAEAEFERLWTETTLPSKKIQAIMRERFGFVATVQQLVGQATRRGINRWAVSRGKVSPPLIAERLFADRWKRWAEPSERADNPVRKVEPGAYPANGFSMIGRRI